MKTVRRAVASLVLVLAVAPVAGCTFGTFPHSSKETLAAVPPCYSGDVCAVAFDSSGFMWTTDVTQAARR